MRKTRYPLVYANNHSFKLLGKVPDLGGGDAVFLLILIIFASNISRKLDLFFHGLFTVIITIMVGRRFLLDRLKLGTTCRG